MSTHSVRNVVRNVGVSTAVVAGLVAGGVSAAGAATTTTQPAGSSNQHVEKGMPGAPGHHAPGGKVTAISDTSITVSNPKGDSKTFTINSDTKFMKWSETATSSDVTVGSLVRIMPTAKGSNTAAKIMVGVPHVAGKVTAVNGSSVSITNREGKSFTVVESDSTKFTKNGAAATSADVVVGQVIVAQGSFASGSTTTLNATSIMVGLPGPGASGMQHGPDGGPHGGPDGGPHGGPDGAPQGADQTPPQ